MTHWPQATESTAAALLECPRLQCCTYDYQALFECCTPCVFGGVPLGVACVILWCNYCAVAHCTEYYAPCEDWW